MNQSIEVNTSKRHELTNFFSKRRHLIIDIIRAVLILLFVYASVSKLVDFKVFYGEINSQPFPNWMTAYLVWIIPSIEILIAIGLMFHKTKLISLYASFILMTIFTIYIGLILLYVFDRIPCSCGGVLKQLGWKEHFFFNLFFVLISLLASVLEKNRR